MIQYTVVLYAGRITTCVTTFIAGTFWLFISIAKDLKRNLCNVSEIIRDGASVAEITEGFIGIIKLHASAKELVLLKSFNW